MPSTCVIDITSADLANLRPSTVGERATAWQTIVHADIITLPTVAIELVPAPLSTQLLLMTRALMVIDTLAGAYGNVNADAAAGVFWDDMNGPTAGAVLYNSSGDSMTPVNDAGFGAAHKRFVHFNAPFLYAEPAGTLTSADFNDLANAAGKRLAFAIYNNGAGDLTGGNGANTVKVKTFYIVVDLP